MPGEIVNAAQILAGSGAAGWVIEKLLGPSADGLGEQLKIYGTDRIKAILSKFSQKTLPEKVNSLPPGFAYQFFQKASFSEDDELITDMWANLLVNASDNYDQSSSIFIDCLSQITSKEAIILNSYDLKREFDEKEFRDISVNFSAHLLVLIREVLQLYGVNKIIRNSETIEAMTFLLDYLNSRLDRFWPFEIVSIENLSVGWQSKGDDGYQTFGNSVVLRRGSSFDILERQTIVRCFSVNFKDYELNIQIVGYNLTRFGADFLAACRSGRK